MRFNRLHEATDYIVPTDYTQKLSHFAAALSYEDLPKEVRHRAKQIVMQALGSALSVKNTDLSEKAEKVSLAGNHGEGGPCTSWGTGNKMSAVNAGFAAGTKTDLPGWGECSDRGHFYSVIVPAAWIAAEEEQKSGRELLTAVTAAYEVCTRIADAVQPDEAHRKLGWGVTSWSVFGAVIAAAKLYGLDARQIDQAIGLGCECSTIPASYSYTAMSDYLHCEYGNRVRDGILIAKSVKNGINNCRDTLDETSCYSCAFTDDWKPERYTEKLGVEYVIMDTCLKQWPACFSAQPVLDTVQELVKKNGIPPEKIDRIAVDIGYDSGADVPEEGFKSTLQAYLCLPYTIAAMLYVTDPALWYDEENLNSRWLLERARKIQITAVRKVDPVSMDAILETEQAGHVTIITVSGQEYLATLRGHVEAEQTDAATVFIKQMTAVGSEEFAARALAVLEQLDTCDNIAELGWLVGAGWPDTVYPPGSPDRCT